jgi:CheY-like chemotaxis protein
VSGKHLLVVDDSQTVRKLVEISLRSSRYTADFATCGAEGALLATRRIPDLILLDFVLPDMRGTEVCANLAKDPRTAGIPVVLMTAKGENVRDLFSAYSSVVDYIGKPFTPTSVVEAIDRALTRRKEATLAPRAAQRTFTFAQKELAAGKVYARLKGAFAAIPRWMGDLGREQPAPFFARKILSPDVIDDLLESLLPFCRSAVAEQVARNGDEAQSLHDGGFHGHVESWPLADIVTLFGASGRCGELTLALGERTIVVYFRKGEVVLITTRDPYDYARGCTVDLRFVTAETIERARTEQRSSGKPLHISVAEAGELPECDLTGTLHGRSRRLLADALEARAGRFRWRDLTTFPSYVEAYGRHVSLTQQRDTLMFGPPDSNPPPASSLSQITLERLRLQHAAEAYAHAPRPRGDAVYARTQGFSQRLPQFSIMANERKVLAVVDGRSTVDEIVAKCGLPVDEVTPILNRLSVVGLLYPRPTSSTPAPSGPMRLRPIMILEPDVEGFQRPLESLLMSRADPIELLSLAEERDVLAAVMRERPRMVILNVDAATADACRTAIAIREERELEDLPLVAVLEAAAAGGRADELATLGFSAVLVKPILYSDLERLLA